MSVADLDHLRQVVSLESITVSNLSAGFKNTMSAMRTALTKVFDKFTPDQPPIALGLDTKAILKNIEKHRYTDMAVLKAYTPEGLKTGFLQYAEALRGSVEHVSKLNDSVMAPYSMFLGQLISTDAGVSNRSAFDAGFKQSEVLREALNGEVTKCLAKTSTKTETSLDKVVSRNKDWEELFVALDEMSLTMARVDRKVLNKQIATCVEYLDIINRSKVEYSNNTIQNLADSAFQVASELEFYSVTYYRFMVLVESVRATVEHMEKVLKK